MEPQLDTHDPPHVAPPPDRPPEAEWHASRIAPAENVVRRSTARGTQPAPGTGLRSTVRLMGVALHRGCLRKSFHDDSKWFRDRHLKKSGDLALVTPDGEP